MKSVLISIRPKWVEKIASGKKTIEVRKTAPKEVPFKAYIYCTKGKTYLYRVDDDNNFELTNTLRPKTYEYVKDYNEQNGKVIGEFICDKVYDILPHNDGYKTNQYEMGWKYGEADCCLSFDELYSYLGDRNGYGWHIYDLKIYDEPKELSEFYRPCSYSGICYSCNRFRPNGTPNDEPNDFCDGEITRPPQSWQYVEELEK